MLKRFAALFLLPLLVPVTASAQTSPPLPVIIDTDMAADDWMAILYLLRRDDLNVRAITLTGAGEAHCDPGLQNLMNLLALANHPDIPVACGRETPFIGDRAFPADLREKVDNMAGIPLPTNPNPLPSETAVELLTRQLRESSEPVTLLTLGPLTNIAEAFQADPALIDHIARIYIMGGAVNVPGNVSAENPHSEWNFYVDPVAADIVIRSGAPITLVPLNATDQTPITISFLSRLDADRTTPEAEFVFHVLEDLLTDPRGGYFFWDPLAAVALTNPEVVRVQGRAISLIAEEGFQLGRVIPDGEGSRVDVAVDVDVAAFERIFLNVLNGRDPAASTLPITIAAGSESDAALVQRYYEQIWAAHNWDILPELIAVDDYAFYSNGSRGDVNALSGTVAMLTYVIPDLQLTIEELIVAGDTAAARIVLRGTNTVGYGNLEPTGFPLTLNINTVLHLRDGKVVAEWITFDYLNFFILVGVIGEDALATLYEGAPD